MAILLYVLLCTEGEVHTASLLYRMFGDGDMELGKRSKADIELSAHNDEVKDNPSSGHNDKRVAQRGLDVRQGLTSVAAPRD